MIIAKVPLRISFFGGGTDIPSFYKKNNYGCVLNTTVDKFLFITIKNHGDLFYEKFRLNYSISETANQTNEIKNKIFKETIKRFSVKEKLYLSTISDVPASSGLGSSSALVVGLFLLFNKKYKCQMKKFEIVEEAAQFEIKEISNFIGKQDHYSSFYGGMNYFEFHKNEKVKRIKIKNLNFIKQIEKKLIFFWTGIQRDANRILEKQDNNLHRNSENLIKMRNITIEVLRRIKNNMIDYKIFGEFLDESWILKKKLSSVISDDHINNCYEIAKKNGAIGGKLLGAGGGGFLMLLAPQISHKKIIFKLQKKNLIHEKIKFFDNGPSLISF